MRIQVMGLALAAVLATACSNLPTIDEEGCGNRVVNVEEDCDGASPFGEGTACGAANTANACHLVCGGAEGLVCPSGWGCGADGRCRAPGGEFVRAPGSPWRFRVEDFVIGDVDGDAKNDLIGSDLSRLTIRYGSDNGEFPTELDFITPPTTGHPTFAKLSQDARLDAVVPVVGGIFSLLGRADRTLDPVPYAPFDVPQEGPIRVVPLDAQPDYDWEVMLIAAGGMAFEESGFANATALPGNHNVIELVGRIPTGYLDRDVFNPLSSDDRAEFALAFAGTNRVFVYEALGVGPTLRPSLRETVFLPGAILGGARFADVDGNGYLDLLASYREGDGTARVAVAYNTGGSFELVASPFAALDRTKGDPWPLAAGDLNGDGRADYVYNDAIVIAGGGPVPGEPVLMVGTVFAIDEPWAEATLTDINGDGALDPAVIIEGDDGVEIYLNTGIGVFNKYQIDTDAPPLAVRAGDFDGDLVYDIAVVEGGFGVKPDRVSVIFGARQGGPSAPVDMGSLGLIEAFEPMLVNNFIEGLDLITDLLVVASTDESRAVALLAGTTSRRMLAPFTLQVAGEQRADIPIATLVGAFGDVDDGIRDIVAVTQPAADFFGGSPATGPQNARLWRIDGAGIEGNLNPASAESLQLPDYDEFDFGCALFVAGELDPNGTTPSRLELLGLDNNADCQGSVATPAPRLLVGRFDPVDGFDYDILEFSAELVTPTSLELVNFDADDDLDVVAVFRGISFGIAADGSKSGVAVFWNDGGISVDRMTTVALPGGVGVFGGAPIQIDLDPELELVILGSDGVYLAELDPLTQRFAEPVRVFDAFTDGKIAVGDLNADGLLDLAFTTGNSVEIALQRAAAPLGAEQLDDFSDSTGAGQ